ncbi:MULTISPECIES: putative 7-carboxy-7-deazaguanine synthase QueE [Psychrilyobacter]|uniref:7-carboxy-7-deazaguanine synthase n=1 Tax=Psychrilyobacter piezotolerans TaxID=2293438 RepID=A0ABX9KE81_9FUSO|nr:MULTISPECIES: putative 7-carboxy-7-deazaguanine synthase QueE [Psychrilyobacter]MCS5421968.1 putative 7-carboxy-7-deazaguanine synthase QueE [Psychrilyobacter sp. S5]NDI78837.1 putative 7-carboxy-7-deazaguanine synthase QueE [Psychrilyobacter piezotolerans]RDE59438.1 putative 7-carboxy-7-deazaguanine synthase QueE [Psychrilyobacter sp. S5]REI39908.1 putative 7-carboxy-7-deazaguanine synthase QueE [Psychrilyobacter piezotolerans]
MKHYNVVEKFISINGEGQRSGELAVFIRLAKCNLRCNYCDTMWANEENAPVTAMTKEDIYNYILDTKVKNITLTGGEPLLDREVKDLIEYIVKDKSLFLEIETNGSIDLNLFRSDAKNLSFTMDYKGPSSEMEKFMFIKNFETISHKDTVKFVVGDYNDLLKAKEIMEKYDLMNRCSVYFSSVYKKIELDEIVEFMKKFNLNGVRLQLQMHKFIWGNKQGV